MPVPHGAERQGLRVLQQLHPAEVVPGLLAGHELHPGLEQREQDGLQHAAGSHGPRAEPVDARVEEVEPEVHPVHAARAHDLLEDGRATRRSAAPRGRCPSARRGEMWTITSSKNASSAETLSADALGGVVVAAVERHHQAVLRRVARGRTRGCRRRRISLPMPKSLPSSASRVSAGGYGIGEDLVERLQELPPVARPVDGRRPSCRRGSRGCRCRRRPARRPMWALTRPGAPRVLDPERAHAPRPCSTRVRPEAAFGCEKKVPFMSSFTPHAAAHASHESKCRGSTASRSTRFPPKSP